MANWTTLETIAAVRAALHTSQYNQNEASEELCRQTLNNYLIFYREATQEKEGQVFRMVDGEKCDAGHRILPEHVFNPNLDPS
jgi:DNA mismatch repair ATPase MutS